MCLYAEDSRELRNYYYLKYRRTFVMATIHVNTDVMRQLGNRFIDWNNKMQNEMNPELRNLTSQLENDWQGVSRAHYDDMVRSWEQNIANLINTGEQLGNHLNTTAQQFDDADRS